MYKLLKFKIRLSKKQQWELSLMSNKDALSYQLSFLHDNDFQQRCGEWRDQKDGVLTNMRQEYKRHRECGGIWDLKEKLKYRRIKEAHKRQTLINSIPVTELEKLLKGVT